MNDQPGADASPDPEVEPEEEPTPVDAGFGNASDDPEDEESEAESPPADEDNVEEKTDPVQQRIDTLTRKFREAERSQGQLARENSELRERLANPPKAAEPLKGLADFDHDQEEYGRYLVEESTRQATEAAKAVASKSASDDAARQVVDRFEGREKDFESEVNDYHKVAYNTDLKISDTMVGEIRASDVGPDMAYYLGKNPDEAVEIHSLQSPREQVRRMMRLEDQVRAEKSKASKKVSDAPPPPKKIGGANAALKVATTDPKSDKMSDKDWYAAEERRLAKLPRS